MKDICLVKDQEETEKIIMIVSHFYGGGNLRKVETIFLNQLKKTIYQSYLVRLLLEPVFIMEEKVDYLSFLFFQYKFDFFPYF